MKIDNFLVTVRLPKIMKSGYVLYARKSSESEDKQVASIDDQLSVLHQLAQERNLTILQEFTESRSAKDPGRPVFNELLAYIKEHQIKGVICWKVNRLFRNPIDEGVMRWLLQNRDIEEIVTPGKIYLEADSDFLMAVEGAQASRFIKDLRTDTLRGLQKKMDAGIAPVLAPPGYFNDTTKQQGLRTIEPHSTYFPVMRRIFDYALTGNYSIQRLFEMVRGMGLRSSRGETISRTRFYMLMSNPVFYTGRYLYKGIVRQGIHKRMLSDDEFDLITTIYKKHEIMRTEDTTRAYNGLLHCFCGDWLTGECHKKTYKNGTSQSFIYYKCHHPGHAYISVKFLEEQIVSYLSNIALKRHYVELYVEWLNERNQQQKELREARRVQLERTKIEVIGKIDRLLELYLSPLNVDKAMLSDQEFAKRKEALRIEKQKAIDDLTNLDQQMDQWNELTVKSFQFCTSATEKFKNGTIEDKRAIVRAFGSNLTVSGRKIEIKLRTPFELIQRYVAQDALVEPITRSLLAMQTPNFQSLNSFLGGVRESDPLKLPPQGSA